MFLPLFYYLSSHCDSLSFTVSIFSHSRTEVETRHFSYISQGLPPHRVHALLLPLPLSCTACVPFNTKTSVYRRCCRCCICCCWRWCCSRAWSTFSTKPKTKKNVLIYILYIFGHHIQTIVAFSLLCELCLHIHRDRGRERVLPFVYGLLLPLLLPL